MTDGESEGQLKVETEFKLMFKKSCNQSWTVFNYIYCIYTLYLNTFLNKLYGKVLKYINVFSN